jgi:hypothetical protein
MNSQGKNTFPSESLTRRKSGFIDDPDFHKSGSGKTDGGNGRTASKFVRVAVKKGRRKRANMEASWRRTIARVILFGLVVFVIYQCFIFFTEVHVHGEYSPRSLRSDNNDNNKDKQPQWIAIDGDDNDKGPILQLLKDAGISDLPPETLDQLPTWSQVT